MITFTFNNKKYKPRGLLGFIGTVLMLPGFSLTIILGIILATCALIAMMPGMLIALPTAKRIT